MKNKLSIQPNLGEKIHDMLSEYNTQNKYKVFYYSEREVKELCKLAHATNLPSDTFEIWWEQVKKK
jgi:hypothetical protein